MTWWEFLVARDGYHLSQGHKPQGDVSIKRLREMGIEGFDDVDI